MAALINVNIGGGRRGRRRRGTGFHFPGGRGGRKPWWWGIIVLILAGASYLAKQQGWISDTPRRTSTNAPAGGPVAAERRSSTDLSELIRSRRSGERVEAAGTVTKTLPDDSEGSRHQRFIVQVGGETVLIAHNIDLAPRVPLREGDAVRFRGDFEWNDRGGVIHWTHHDPDSRRPGGWIEHRGKRYE